MEPSRVRRKRWSGRGARVITCTWILTATLLSGWPAVFAADEEETTAKGVRYLEAGASYTHFTENLEDGNTQSLAIQFHEDWSYRLRFDLEHSARWGDRGIWIGSSYTHYFAGSWSIGVGAGTGSGDFILPDYRFEVSAGKGFLAGRNLLAVLTYVHEKSKGPNYYDRLAPSIVWWVSGNWIFGGHFYYDIGQPGNTITRSGGIEATWYTWKKRYVGAVFEFGDVNYTQVGPTDFLVAYKNVSGNVHFTEYLNPKSGLIFRFDWGTNELYNLYGISVRYFTEW